MLIPASHSDTVGRESFLPNTRHSHASSNQNGAGTSKVLIPRDLDFHAREQLKLQPKVVLRPLPESVVTKIPTERPQRSKNLPSRFRDYVLIG